VAKDFEMKHMVNIKVSADGRHLELDVNPNVKLVIIMNSYTIC
jgi:hypothetical protein